MNRDQALSKMISPGMKRPTAYRQGIVQIWVTRACDLSCFNCTQLSNLKSHPGQMHITPDQFEIAVKSLQNHWGVAAIFGGNPAVHPKFPELCEILRKYIPKERRGLWCNHPRGHGAICRETFNPSVSNLNVHLSVEAFEEFKRDWPECNPVGLREDSRHAPCFIAMKDVVKDEATRWDLISSCDVNHLWSSMICVVNGEVKGFFCEIAGSMAMIHANDEIAWEDGGLEILDYKEKNGREWWEEPMTVFGPQVDQACHNCSVPLRIRGELAIHGNKEQVSKTHAGIYKPKVKNREIEIVANLIQIGGTVKHVTSYLGNAKQ